jgi:O-antigen/teichoic acid export membrane protein
MAEPSLTTRTLSGAKWSAIGRVAQQVVALSTTAVMARLLTPADYGLIGMCTFFLGFASIFRDLGMSSAVIQQKRVEEPLPSTAFWLNAIFGGLTCVACVLGAPLVARFYHTPALTNIMRSVSLAFLVSSLGSVPSALLSRAMAFRKVAVTEVVTTLAAAGVGISCAWSGLGVWSLVAANLTSATTESLAFGLQSGWRPKWAFDFAQIRNIFGFSANLSGFQILNYFARNADNMLLGRYVGATALGFYQYAYTLMLYPLDHVSAALGRVMFPAFSQVQDDNQRFRIAYTRVCVVIAAMTFPMTLGLVAVAGPLIDVFLGPRWHPAARLLMILAPVGLVQSIVTMVGHIYMAKGRTDWMFRWGLFACPLLVASFVVGLPWGTEGVAISYAAVFYALTPAALAIPFRLIDLSLWEFVKRLMPALEYSLLMFLATIVTRIGLEQLGLRPAAVLPACVATGIIVYSALLLWRKPLFLHDLALLAGNRLPIPVSAWLARHEKA